MLLMPKSSSKSSKQSSSSKSSKQQSSSSVYSPGSDNNPAGKYQEVGPRGGSLQNARQVSIKKGERLPPTQQSGNKWTKMS
jgi:hypothetical protein